MNSEFDDYWWDDESYKNKNVGKMKKHVPEIDEPHRITAMPYNCIDSGAFYITCFRSDTIKEIDKDKTGDNDDESVVKNVTKAINGAAIGESLRFKMTCNSKRIL